MKKIVTISLAAAIVIGGSIAINHGYAQEDNEKNTKVEQTKELIDIEKAKTAALEQVDGTVESVELDKGFSKTYYEVDIDNGQKEFDIEVDAYTAEILKVDENRDDNDDNDDREGQISASTNGAIISEKEAIAIAKKYVIGEVVEIELDEDDARHEYEMEIRTEQGEAEITIDAHSKKVVEQENENE